MQRGGPTIQRLLRTGEKPDLELKLATSVTTGHFAKTSLKKHVLVHTGEKPP